MNVRFERPEAYFSTPVYFKLGGAAELQRIFDTNGYDH